MKLIYSITLIVLFSSHVLSAADFSRVSAVSSYTFDNVNYRPDDTILIDGKIEKGDFEKFVSILGSFSDEKDFFPSSISDDVLGKIQTGNNQYDEMRLGVEINSIGGDVIEAIKIGRLIEKFRLETSMGKQCLSACFFIYVGGVQRVHYSKPKLGVHRPYFDPVYFSDLTSSQAKTKHSEMIEVTKNYLREMNVAQELIELTYRTSPSDILYLTSDQFEKWIGEYQPFFEDWLQSNCTHIEKPTKQEEQDFIDSLGTDKFSEGYKNYLYKKVRAHWICVNNTMKQEQMRILFNQ